MEVRIVKPTIEHARRIADGMRELDRIECRCFGHTPYEALLFGMDGGVCMTVLFDGEPVMMFGGDDGLYGESGEIWALGTAECERSPRAMLEIGREAIRIFLGICPRWHNYTLARYEKSIRWLRKLGFRVSDRKERFNGQEFVRIEIGGDSDV